MPYVGPIPLRLQLNHPKGGCITPLGRLRSGYGSCGADPGQHRVGNDYDIVVMGIAHILQQYQERVVIAELDTNQAVSDMVDTLLKHSSGLWCASTGMDGTRRSGTTASTGTATRKDACGGSRLRSNGSKAEPVSVRVEKLRGWFAPADGEDALWPWLPRCSW